MLNADKMGYEYSQRYEEAFSDACKISQWFFMHGKLCHQHEFLIESNPYSFY
jgi:hypothetical protein